MDGTECSGVEISSSGRFRKRQATTSIHGKEVILSGGAFNTPQVLLLSGIGPRSEVESHGIDCCHHLPGVGQNLQGNLAI